MAGYNADQKKDQVRHFTSTLLNIRLGMTIGRDEKAPRPTSPGILVHDSMIKFTACQHVHI